MATGKTFFSYSRTDSAFVLKLAKDLRDAGVELWLDQLDIKGGSHWDSAIEKALNTAASLIVVLSDESVKSNNVMDEVSFALESGKTVIPVLLEECVVPFRLRRLQRIDFTGDYRAALSQLLEVLKQTTDYATGSNADNQAKSTASFNAERETNPVTNPVRQEAPYKKKTTETTHYDAENAKAKEPPYKK
ncbi:MAG TPA: toll/interleukin-1 receptor domain-containing protein, partial [Flavisolibacter sp.]|nr:toll/interleukin-1 receptor domain-containing protein [Flavisolibacter sp.]